MVDVEDTREHVQRAQALIDSGTDINLVAAHVVQQAKAALQPASTTLAVIGGHSLCDVRQATNLKLQPQNPSFRTEGFWNHDATFEPRK